jgi:hypothetical protein
MQLIGDLGRDIFGALYDWRLVVLAGSVIAGSTILALAIRRGWFSAARRHPGRSGALVAVVLAIGLPLTWYLASPIFLRTSLVEAEDAVPVVVPAASPDRAAAPTPAPTPFASATAIPSEAPTASPTPAPTAFRPAVVAIGSFHGSDEFHFGKGTATIVETAPGRYRLRFADFSVRNGPDLYVYLSPSADGYADGSLELGRLKATDGAFGYDLPAGTDPADFASAVVWCKQFSHLFATAPLSDA